MKYSRTLGMYGLIISRILIVIDHTHRFKSTSALVTAFEARRLPRAYLVLLESLLHVHPAARPTCERVLNAIREGRVCLLEANLIKN